MPLGALAFQRSARLVARKAAFGCRPALALLRALRTASATLCRRPTEGRAGLARDGASRARKAAERSVAEVSVPPLSVALRLSSGRSLRCAASPGVERPCALALLRCASFGGGGFANIYLLRALRGRSSARLPTACARGSLREIEFFNGAGGSFPPPRRSGRPRKIAAARQGGSR